ncbi:MAG TPA: DUF1127 domain-containing protein [Geminicoccaceae bacterium]|nr:DUF1127 domain-containing protein [Geminicoccaceae bacterium]
MIARTATIRRFSHSVVLPHTDLLAAALGVLRTAIEGVRWTVWRQYQVRRTRRQVANLSNHLLDDIGLSRSMLLGATIRRVREEEAIRRGAAW